MFWTELSNTARVLTWREGAGLVTIMASVDMSPTGGADYFHDFRRTTVTNDADNVRLYFTNTPSNRVWSWRDGVLTTVSATKGGVASMVVSPVDGRVFFGSGGGAQSGFWTWKDGVGLSTIRMTESSNQYPGWESYAVAGDGRVYFGERGWYGATGGFWTWKAGEGEPLKVKSYATNKYPGKQSTGAGPDGRGYWGDESSFWAWIPPSDCF